AAFGEPARKAAVVDVEGVEVRAGHALGFPAVGQLHKGDSVIVVREEETGFLAIVPPTGSMSWVKQIHLDKVVLENGKANVPIAVEGAEVMAGSDKDAKPTNRVTTRLPKGTIVEVTGPAVRIETASWFPIVPPEGDLRWIPKSAIKTGSLTALTPPAPYVRPETPGFTVSADPKAPPTARPAAAALPTALTDHRLWNQASQAERSSDFATAKALYARIYQDLWDQKAERDAIVICYNRYKRCDEAVKQGDNGTGRTRTESRSEAPPAADNSHPTTSSGKWSNPGYLQEVQKVFVDGQPVYALQDDRGSVVYYVTAVSGINLRNYNGKRVQVYGAVATRAELYKPHMTVERVEIAK
ncbi:MAG TPA: hypothetical protein VHR66_13955, partial [Gemmataceae bacterium]|nr:hypothetical protein [Gemmataceae bacterium]